MSDWISAWETSQFEGGKGSDVPSAQLLQILFVAYIDHLEARSVSYTVKYSSACFGSLSPDASLLQSSQVYVAAACTVCISELKRLYSVMKNRQVAATGLG